MGRRSSRGPFERLGELKRARPAPKTPSPGDLSAPPLRQASAQPDDTALFRDAVRDAQPLQAVPGIEHRPRATAAPRRVPRDTAAPPPAPPGTASGAAARAGFDADTHAKPGVGPDVLRKLRRLEWPVEAELSVRGMTQDEAWGALRTFLSECAAHGARCVRVIHGKGMQSPGRMPVLKGRMRAWLAQDADVRAFTEAPPAAGGSGALIVLLKGRT
jgi:DNA-nicking Smr family endonuclease